VDDDDIKSDARRKVQEEKYLDDDSILAIFDVVADVQMARTYLDIKRESLCKCWIQKELEKMNRRMPDFSQTDT
jgi:hypothetical protein